MSQILDTGGDLARRVLFTSLLDDPPAWFLALFPGLTAPTVPINAFRHVFTDEAQCLFRTSVFRCEDVDMLREAADDGSDQAHWCLRAGGRYLARVCSAATEEALACQSCDACFSRERMPEAIVLCLGWGDEPTVALVSGLCHACAANDDADLMSKAVAAWERQHLLTGASRIEAPVAYAGTA